MGNNQALTCLIAEPPGNLHVAWVDERDGNMEIYYRMYLDPQTGISDGDGIIMRDNTANDYDFY